jgi:beta-glucosidase
MKLSTGDLKAGDALTVEVNVKNTGSIAGDEVSELYLIPPQSSLAPKLALAGFQRFHLDPGATRHVTFTLDPRTLSQVDEKGIRAVISGYYKLSLGSSQPDGDAASTAQSATFSIAGRKEFPR